MGTHKVKTDDEIMTIDEVAELLRVSTSYIYKQTMNNTMPFRKIGNQLRFVRREILDWFNKQTA